MDLKEVLTSLGLRCLISTQDGIRATDDNELNETTTITQAQHTAHPKWHDPKWVPLSSLPHPGDNLREV
jgi:hypothetical protein